MIYGILFLSLIINLALGWYIRELLVRFNEIGELAKGLDLSLEYYEKHLGNVYELETYYGDETLSGLLRHTGDLKKEIEEYRTIFIFEEDIQVDQSNEQDKNNEQEENS